VIEQAAWDSALAAIKAARSVTVVGHVHPDGDALGSVLALSLALRRLGLEVTASFPEPYELPTALAILPGRELLIEPGRVPAVPELLIAVDTASLARLGTLADRVDTAGTVLVIDHHASNTGFGQLRLIDPDAAAAGMVVAGLLDRLGITYDVSIASCLYAAISSDTGSFRFGSTTAEVHRLAARLLEMASLSEHDLQRFAEASRRIAARFGPDLFAEGLDGAAMTAINLQQKRLGLMDRALLFAAARYGR